MFGLWSTACRQHVKQGFSLSSHFLVSSILTKQWRLLFHSWWALHSRDPVEFTDTHRVCFSAVIGNIIDIGILGMWFGQSNYST